MPLIKALSLVVPTILVALALALVGAPAISATELCKAEEDPCSLANIYASGTALEASSSEAVFETSLAKVVCKKSSMSGETLAKAGDPLAGAIDSLTFGECKAGEISCTTEAKALPYYTALEKTTENAGTLTIHGDGTQLAAFLNCGELIKCTLTTKAMEVAVQGGKSAKIIASKEAFEKTEGGACPKTSSLTATYAVSTPELMRIDDRPTTLCKKPLEVDGTCPATQAFSGGIKGYLPGINELTIVSTQGPTGTVTCTESPFSGSFNSAAGNVTGELTAMEMKSPGGKCSSSLGGSPDVAVTVENLPATLSSFVFFKPTADQGAMYVGGNRNVKIKMVPTGAGTDCIYTMLVMETSVANPEVVGMAASPDRWIGERAAGLTNVCPAEIEVKALWRIETVGNEKLWLAKG